MNVPSTGARRGLSPSVGNPRRPLSLALALCSTVVVSVVTTIIYVAPVVSAKSDYVILYDGVASLFLITVFAWLAAWLQAPVSENQAATPVEALKAAPQPIVASALDADTRADRRARMAALIEQVRTETQESFEGDNGQSGLAKRLASLAGDSTNCATRATEFLSKSGNPAPDSASALCDLAAQAQEIGEILEIVQSIAAQINLLSLNAALEAAYAGEAGRGFANMARDVKSLAGQAARATDRVAEHVAAIQSATGTAVAALSAQLAHEMVRDAVGGPREALEHRDLIIAARGTEPAP